ncbi:DUF1906 domain-containing protein [Streptomyces sp. NPDC003077]|uniref:DUF1906 domain-containing protein n=1 Tax=Streptomyces sp. NPDC003077 TaxID=3154443 RepID=UPI0033B3DA4F
MTTASHMEPDALPVAAPRAADPGDGPDTSDSLFSRLPFLFSGHTDPTGLLNLTGLTGRPPRPDRPAPTTNQPTQPDQTSQPSQTSPTNPTPPPTYPPPSQPTATPPPSQPTPTPQPLQPTTDQRTPRVFDGWALDTCNAPSQETLRAWQDAKYRAIGVYFGGRGRYCRQQPNLTPDWLRATDRLGWGVLPVYVGSQPPCVVGKHRRRFTIGDHPWEQGVAEGRDAVRSARRLGIAPVSPLYLDIEAYRPGATACGRTTLRYIRAWSREVRRHGYLAGFYGSTGSGVRQVDRARAAGVPDLPTVMWFARWSGRPALYGEAALSRRAWHPHRRIHQYAGNVRETHGGHALKIDRNRVDAPVAWIR